jgi:phosphate/sulfate permease
VSTLAGPFLVAVALLLAGGALKVVRPAFTARALRDMGLPVSATIVRVGALVELGIAAGEQEGDGHQEGARERRHGAAV